MKVYEAINAVSAQLAREGIGKSRENEQQGYKFRGIDEVMNALAPLLANHKLIIFPRIGGRQCEARTTKSGSVLYSVTVDAEFDFVSAEDGSKHTVRTPGEGMDSGDKATNKAMAAAYKYAAFQTFCIPLEGSGDVDADATTPEPTGWSSPESPQPAPTTQEAAPSPRQAAPLAPKPTLPAPVKEAASAPSLPRRGANKEPAGSRPHHPADAKPHSRTTHNDLTSKLAVYSAGLMRNRKTLPIAKENLAKWEKYAKPVWANMNKFDADRVAKEREKFLALIAEVEGAGDKVKAPAPKTEDVIDPDTGDLKEAAA